MVGYAQPFGAGDNYDANLPSADSRQLYYFHIHKLKMQISEFAINAGTGDVKGLLLWCGALLELYRNLKIPDKDRPYYETLMDIEDEILMLQNQMRLFKSSDEAIKFQARNEFVSNYSRIQRQLHEKQISLFVFRWMSKMEVPFEENIDALTKLERSIGLSPDEEDALNTIEDEPEEQKEETEPEENVFKEAESNDESNGEHYLENTEQQERFFLRDRRQDG